MRGGKIVIIVVVMIGLLVMGSGGERLLYYVGFVVWC
jgi:hypothetical protein